MTVLSLPILATAAVAAGAVDWDANSDKRLDRSEFDTGFDRAGVFKKYDSDANGKLSQTEFKSGFAKHEQGLSKKFGSDYYSRWDADRDGSISKTELNEGIYTGYDRNKDKFIAEPEINDLGDDMGDGGFWDV